MSNDATLAQLLERNSELFATYGAWAAAQVKLLAGTIDDPDSFNAQGGKTGALGYYPVENVSGQVIYVPSLARLQVIAAGGGGDLSAVEAVLAATVLAKDGALAAKEAAQNQADAIPSIMQPYVAQAQGLVGAAQTALQPGALITSLAQTPDAQTLTGAERDKVNLTDISSARYAFGKRIVSGDMDESLRSASFVTEDGFFYGKFAIRIGNAANGLTWTRRGDGFFELSLGTTSGMLPVGSEGDGLASEPVQYMGGKRVVRALADSANRASHAVTSDGYLRGKLGVVLKVANGLTWKLGPDGLTSLTLGTIEGELPLSAAGDVVDTKLQRYHRGKAVVWGNSDKSYRAGLVGYSDGTFWAKTMRSPSIAPAEASLDFAAHVVCAQISGENTQLFAYSKTTGGRRQITSAGSNSAISRSADGTKVVYSTDRHGGLLPYYQAVGEWIEHPVMPRRGLVAEGDSLTAAQGATNPATQSPVALVAAHFGVPFVNLGQPGATAEGVTAYIGAVDPLVTLAGNQIASGANTISAISIPFLSRNGGASTMTQKRTIAGVLGTVTKTGGTAPDWKGSYSFTPDAGQTLPVACPAGTPALLADNTNDELIAFIRVGRNTINGVAFDTPGWSDDAFLRTQQIVAWHKPLVKHFVVLPVPNGNYPSEYQGTSGYNALMAHNARLAAEWPSNYFDDRAVLVAAYDPANAQDVIDYGRDVPPSSLRADNIHYNTAGYAVLGAAHWAFVETKGWLTNPLLAPFA